ncbi:hypothetical protein LSH36_362g02063 [Paralvinella palmiformis]|uniref:Ubiquinone biosynthesis protein n=1 Tax=Paralvinella palmiformis TaxID=53620 RepID=A0AAD9JFI4_9ANNE|nr:hypothetical protein LSH36_362g02063 [Paralvinella palmiformis]
MPSHLDCICWLHTLTPGLSLYHTVLREFLEGENSPLIDEVAMALMALPQNVLESLKRLSYLCDDVWYYAGDRSVDFNWYTKRLTLAGAYNSTELYMMQDKSANFGDTWAFLGRRLEDLHSIGKGVKQVQETSGALGNLILGSCIMARNTLGINDRFR